MGNTVSAKNGRVHVAFVGHQTGEAVERTLGDAMECVQELLKNQKDVDTIVDVRHLTDTTLPARMAVKNSINAMLSRKIAIFGANLKLRTVVNLIITSSRASGRVRIFATEAQALAWLKE